MFQLKLCECVPRFMKFCNSISQYFEFLTCLHCSYSGNLAAIWYDYFKLFEKFKIFQKGNCSESFEESKNPFWSGVMVQVQSSSLVLKTGFRCFNLISLVLSLLNCRALNIKAYLNSFRISILLQRGLVSFPWGFSRASSLGAKV